MSEPRPAEGWLFVEPLDEPYGIIRKVSLDMDTCRVWDVVEFAEPRPIVLANLGWLAVRAENITNWGDNESLRLGNC